MLVSLSAATAGVTSAASFTTEPFVAGDETTPRSRRRRRRMVSPLTERSVAVETCRSSTARRPNRWRVSRGVTQISVGPNLGTCARTSDGSVYCWGRNEYGQLGRPPLLGAASARTDARGGVPSRRRSRAREQDGCAVSSSARARSTAGETPGAGVLDGPRCRQPRVGDRAAAGDDGVDLRAADCAQFPSPIKALAIGTVSELADTVVGQLDDDVLASLGEQALTTVDVRADRTSVASPAGSVRRVARLGVRVLHDGRSDPSVATLLRLAQYPVEGRDRRCEDLTEPPPVPREGRDDARGRARLATGRLFRWGTTTPALPESIPRPRRSCSIRWRSPSSSNQVVSFATTAESTCASLVDGTVKCLGSNAAGELGRGTVDADPHPEAEAIG